MIKDPEGNSCGLQFDTYRALMGHQTNGHKMKYILHSDQRPDYASWVELTCLGNPSRKTSGHALCARRPWTCNRA
eukprot:8331868-Pyramimonas_sp.AAC.1